MYLERNAALEFGQSDLRKKRRSSLEVGFHPGCVFEGPGAVNSLQTPKTTINRKRRKPTANRRKIVDDCAHALARARANGTARNHTSNGSEGGTTKWIQDWPRSTARPRTGNGQQRAGQRIRTAREARPTRHNTALHRTSRAAARHRMAPRHRTGGGLGTAPHRRPHGHRAGSGCGGCPAETGPFANNTENLCSVSSSSSMFRRLFRQCFLGVFRRFRSPGSRFGRRGPRKRIRSERLSPGKAPDFLAEFGVRPLGENLGTRPRVSTSASKRRSFRSVRRLQGPPPGEQPLARGTSCVFMVVLLRPHAHDMDGRADTTSARRRR